MKSYGVRLNLRNVLMADLRRCPRAAPGVVVVGSRERVRLRPHRRCVSSSSFLYVPETRLSQKPRCVFLIFFAHGRVFADLALLRRSRVDGMGDLPSWQVRRPPRPT